MVPWELLKVSSKTLDRYVNLVLSSRVSETNFPFSFIISLNFSCIVWLIQV
jgi:hypothetical protein